MYYVITALIIFNFYRAMNTGIARLVIEIILFSISSLFLLYISTNIYLYINENFLRDYEINNIFWVITLSVILLNMFFILPTISFFTMGFMITPNSKLISLTLSSLYSVLLIFMISISSNVLILCNEEYSNRMAEGSNLIESVLDKLNYTKRSNNENENDNNEYTEQDYYHYDISLEDLNDQNNYLTSLNCFLSVNHPQIVRTINKSIASFIPNILWTKYLKLHSDYEYGCSLLPKRAEMIFEKEIICLDE